MKKNIIFLMLQAIHNNSFNNILMFIKISKISKAKMRKLYQFHLHLAMTVNHLLYKSINNHPIVHQLI